MFNSRCASCPAFFRNLFYFPPLFHHFISLLCHPINWFHHRISQYECLSFRILYVQLFLMKFGSRYSQNLFGIRFFISILVAACFFPSLDPLVRFRSLARFCFGVKGKIKLPIKRLSEGWFHFLKNRWQNNICAGRGREEIKKEHRNQYSTMQSTWLHGRSYWEFSVILHWNLATIIRPRQFQNQNQHPSDENWKCLIVKQTSIYVNRFWVKCTEKWSNIGEWMSVFVCVGAVVKFNGFSSIHWLGMFVLYSHRLLLQIHLYCLLIYFNCL